MRQKTVAQTKTIPPFVQIAVGPMKVDGGKGGLYALDGSGRVFYYADRDGDEGWVQLAFDDKRSYIGDEKKEEA